MSYLQYKGWLRELTEEKLDDEVVKLRNNRDGADYVQARNAWDYMLNLALGEIRRRRNDG